jgi:outer membrane lipopolysaccharide assembly protein LptE/RlpB
MVEKEKKRLKVAGVCAVRSLGFAVRGLALAAACLLLLECGYNLRGTGSFLPPNVKKVQIPLFKNYTTRFELDKNLTQSVIDEFVARGQAQVITDPKEADAVLSGDIMTFAVNPIGFSGGQGTADHYAIIIVARVTLTDSKTQKVIYSNPSYVYNEDYEVPQGKDFDSVETEAIKKVSVKFARNLVVAILEGF